jgi:hypothetical protein
MVSLDHNLDDFIFVGPSSLSNFKARDEAIALVRQTINPTKDSKSCNVILL